MKYITPNRKPQPFDGWFLFDGLTTVLTEDATDALAFRDFTGCIAGVNDFFTAITSAGYQGEPYGVLTGYNDNGATFAQIAAAIRAVPEAVFTEGR